MSFAEQVIKWVDQQGWLDPISESIQPPIMNLFKSAGKTGQKVMDFLHGTWLGHPLHPVLTDVPTGAYTASATLDALEMATGNEAFAAGSDAALALGISGAVGSAVTGLTDWQHTVGSSRRIGMMHALLNTTALAFYATSLAMRARRKREAGWSLALMGYATTLAAAYLGGHLVYGEKIGVNHAPETEMLPEKFTPVMPEADLPENQLHKAFVENIPVLLVRRGRKIYALAETCAHLGGPLSEGELKDDSVICPWHASRFGLEEGRLIHGPSTFPQPSFETRIRNGQIEVRAAPSNEP